MVERWTLEDILNILHILVCNLYPDIKPWWQGSVITWIILLKCPGIVLQSRHGYHPVSAQCKLDMRVKFTLNPPGLQLPPKTHKMVWRCRKFLRDASSACYLLKLSINQLTPLGNCDCEGIQVICYLEGSICICKFYFAALYIIFQVLTHGN